MSDATTSTVHPAIDVKWLGDRHFDAGRPGRPRMRIDGDGESALAPFDTLLAAIASCAAVDVVTILGKQRTPAQSLEVRVESTRVTSTPRRLATAVLRFAIRARGAAPAQVERAVELSVTKYCSVRSSLAGDIPVTWSVELRPDEVPDQ